MFNGYATEEDYLDSLKQDDHYHFSIPFEYIVKLYDNDECDVDEAVMEVDVDWDDSEHGYKVSYECPDMYKIDPAEGNGDEDEIYENIVESDVLRQLESMGITCEAMVGGIGR